MRVTGKTRLVPKLVATPKARPLEYDERTSRQQSFVCPRSLRSKADRGFLSPFVAVFSLPFTTFATFRFPFYIPSLLVGRRAKIPPAKLDLDIGTPCPSRFLGDFPKGPTKFEIRQQKHLPPQQQQPQVKTFDRLVIV